MDFQAAPLEPVVVEGSLDLHLDESFVALDSSIDAAMDAAKDAADAVDGLVQHLSTADALHSAPELEEMMSEAVVNESAARSR